MTQLNTPVTETELKAAAIAPRVTEDSIKEQIAGQYFTTLDKAFDGCPTLDPMKVFTLCVLVLKNGYIVTGQSACADPANFNAEIGQRLAYQDAFRQLWPLFGFELKQKLMG